MGCETCGKVKTCTDRMAKKYRDEHPEKFGAVWPDKPVTPKKQKISWERPASTKPGFVAVVITQMNEEARGKGVLYEDGRFQIRSEQRPDFVKYSDGVATLYLPGNDRNKDQAVVYIPDELYGTISDLVTHYNMSLQENASSAGAKGIAGTDGIPTEILTPLQLAPIDDRPLTEVLSGR